MYKESKIYLAGHDGMVGSALLRELNKQSFDKIVYKNIEDLDLRNQKEVNIFFENEKPEIVIIAAAKVGGILANNIYRAEFIYDNLMIASNIINAAHVHKTKKLLFLGSSCIYPKNAPQPLKEEYLLTNTLEQTNEPYAIAKIAGIKLCENYYRQYGDNFFSVMPTNLYGPNDNFNLKTSHVLPALIKKFHDAKIGKKSNVIVWGTGNVYREFLYVDDMANACIELLKSVNADDIYQNGISHINIGSGKDLLISDLAKMVSDIVGYQGDIVYDKSKPDGVTKKLLDVDRLNKFGWQSKISLEEGIQITYKWYLDNFQNDR
jgi:GDP-L-fucose synthase